MCYWWVFFSSLEVYIMHISHFWIIIFAVILMSNCAIGLCTGMLFLFLMYSYIHNPAKLYSYTEINIEMYECIYFTPLNNIICGNINVNLHNWLCYRNVISYQIINIFWISIFVEIMISHLNTDIPNNLDVKLHV